MAAAAADAMAAASDNAMAVASANEPPTKAPASSPTKYECVDAGLPAGYETAGHIPLGECWELRTNEMCDSIEGGKFCALTCDMCIEFASYNTVTNNDFDALGTEVVAAEILRLRSHKEKDRGSQGGGTGGKIALWATVGGAGAILVVGAFLSARGWRAGRGVAGAQGARRAASGVGSFTAQDADAYPLRLDSRGAMALVRVL
jgi:hypothetical protein